MVGDEAWETGERLRESREMRVSALAAIISYSNTNLHYTYPATARLRLLFFGSGSGSLSVMSRSLPGLFREALE